MEPLKVLLINGSPNAKGCTYTALSEVAGILEQEGISTELIHVGEPGRPRLHRLPLLQAEGNLRL